MKPKFVQLRRVRLICWKCLPLEIICTIYASFIFYNALYNPEISVRKRESSSDDEGIDKNNSEIVISPKPAMGRQNDDESTTDKRHDIDIDRINESKNFEESLLNDIIEQLDRNQKESRETLRVKRLETSTNTTDGDETWTDRHRIYDAFYLSVAKYNGMMTNVALLFILLDVSRELKEYWRDFYTYLIIDKYDCLNEPDSDNASSNNGEYDTSDKITATSDCFVVSLIRRLLYRRQRKKRRQYSSNRPHVKRIERRKITEGKVATSKCYDERNFSMPRNHVIYTARLIVAAIVHAVVHTLFTHRPKWYASDTNDEYNENVINSSMIESTPSTAVTMSSSSEATEAATVETTIMPMTSIFVTKMNDTMRTVYKEFLEDVETYTGYILIVLFLLLVMTGHRLKKFLRFHVYFRAAHFVIFAFVAIVLLFHHSNFFVNLIIALIYLAEIIIARYNRRRVMIREIIHYPKFSTSALPSNREQSSTNNYETNSQDVLEIVFSVSKSFSEKCHAGSYVSVCIPYVSRWQWHEFTVLNADSRNGVERRKIIVRCLGLWTRRLFALRYYDSSKSMIMYVRGPYRSWANDESIFKYLPLLLSSKRDFGNTTEKRRVNTFQPSGVHVDTIRLKFVQQTLQMRQAQRQKNENENLSLETRNDAGSQSRNALRTNPYHNFYRTRDTSGKYDRESTDKQSSEKSARIDTLVLVSTGTAVTSHLSVLDELVQRYVVIKDGERKQLLKRERQNYPRSENSASDFAAVCGLPRRIRLVWTIKQIEDITYAIWSFNKYESILRTNGYENILSYHIWVTRPVSAIEIDIFERVRRYVENHDTPIRETDDVYLDSRDRSPGANERLAAVVFNNHETRDSFGISRQNFSNIYLNWSDVNESIYEEYLSTNLLDARTRPSLPVRTNGRYIPIEKRSIDTGIGRREGDKVNGRRVNRKEVEIRTPSSRFMIDLFERQWNERENISVIGQQPMIRMGRRPKNDSILDAITGPANDRNNGRAEREKENILVLLHSSVKQFRKDMVKICNADDRVTLYVERLW